ncbi:hypothetical protein [Marasmitruncus massiliensis]|uniref:hypothetical protein n=1 Tax=Marasmitruncus massiliensis TaxID=1944642 RepID=UPI000C7B85BC|nr:hypothetical protein [Marasmitruncus massiliensis]
MPRFPPPCDELLITINGETVPVQSLPPEEWAAYKKKMMENVGRIMSAELAREAMMSRERDV